MITPWNIEEKRVKWSNILFRYGFNLEALAKLPEPKFLNKIESIIKQLDTEDILFLYPTKKLVSDLFCETLGACYILNGNHWSAAYLKHEMMYSEIPLMDDEEVIYKRYRAYLKIVDDLLGMVQSKKGYDVSYYGSKMIREAGVGKNKLVAVFNTTIKKSNLKVGMRGAFDSRLISNINALIDDIKIVEVVDGE